MNNSEQQAVERIKIVFRNLPKDQQDDMVDFILSERQLAKQEIVAEILKLEKDLSYPLYAKGGHLGVQVLKIVMTEDIKSLIKKEGMEL